MKKYDVTITEILQKSVEIEAENYEEAERIVQERWENSQYVLGTDDFKTVDYNAIERKKNRERER